MAGPYADLSAYQRAAAQPVANPLESLIQGFQTGQQIQRLPQTLQEQEIMRQLNLALAQQKLQDVLNPNAALAREVQQQLAIKGLLNPATGIENAPAGLEGEIIGTPRAIASTAAELAAGAPVTSAAPGLPTTPISVGGIQTGFNLNPTAARAATQQTLNDKIALANARAAELGVPVTYKEGANGEILAIPSRSFGGQIPVATPVKNAAGETVKAAPKGAGKGGLTANQQANLLMKYGAVRELVGDINQFSDEAGNTDFNKLALEVGKAQRTQDLADIQAKQNAIPAGLKDDAAGYISAQKDLASLKSKLLELKDEEPGVLQNAFSVMASVPSTGFFSSVTRQLGSAQLSEETKDKEVIRSGLKTAVQTALSGKALTANEERSLTGLLPQADDTIKDLIRKSDGLENFLNNKLTGLQEGARLGSTSTLPPTPASTGSRKVGRFTVTPVNR